MLSVDSHAFRYKPRGGAIVDKEGTLDSNEFLNVSQLEFASSFSS